MHRFSDSAASIDASPISGIDDIAFSMSEQDRHAEVMISELDGWPAFPLTDATPATSPSPAYGSRPERLAGSSLQDSFIPYPKPVYPGAFSDPFFVHLSFNEPKPPPFLSGTAFFATDEHGCTRM
ncbi:MAG: hypothetical protein ISS69_18430 [Phycisphaerae bacterium]|nr:hypothetical protein [Phycisphaerae bacterium]